MKTNNGLVKGLVNELNGLFGYGDFYIDKDDEMDSYTLYMKAHGNTYGLIKLSKEYKSWIALPSFGLASADVQKNIMDFIYTTNSNYWFDEPEKKYNIIVGLSYGDDEVTAYHKTEKEVWYNEFDEVMCLSTFVSKNDLKLDEYVFTEQEITTLKLSLPENMQQIVDLGKVEVKDE